ncbi:MAG: hypothetical protein PHE53_04735 [Thermoguttaceae bacterium]|nr:hypothetical protein [Thermoguttaceae bacterium]
MIIGSPENGFYGDSGPRSSAKVAGPTTLQDVKFWGFDGLTDFGSGYD